MDPNLQQPPTAAISTIDILTIRINLSQITNPSGDLIEAIACLDRIILLFAKSLNTAGTLQ